MTEDEEKLEIDGEEVVIGITRSTNCEHQMALASSQDANSELDSWECILCGHGENRSKDES